MRHRQLQISIPVPKLLQAHTLPTGPNVWPAAHLRDAPHAGRCNEPLPDR